MGGPGFIFRPQILFCAMLILSIIPSPPAAARNGAPPGVHGNTPVVNGLFYGDGDDALYQLYATSEYGSGLYVYYDASSTRLYVALVVTHTVNDMVCSANRDYTRSAGWNPPRPCNRATDSEYATFTLECAPGSSNSWTWQQAMGCPTNGANPPSGWKSDASCPSSGGNWPPGIQASTSWVANANAYQTAYPYSEPWPGGRDLPWNMYVDGIDLAGWKSPYVAFAPNDVTQVPGYPIYTSYDQLGPYSPDYGWEWSMIYEWSVDLGPAGANCGDDPIWLVSGQSHHSPIKNDDPDRSDDFRTDPNNPPILADWGDLPDSYGTTAANGGARHYLTVSGPRLGGTVQPEPNGGPTADASGDGDEEDGIAFRQGQLWTPGATVNLTATVSGNNGYLVAWIDWDNDGTFSPEERVIFGNLVSGTNPLTLTVPPGASTGGYVYLRFRLYDSANLPAELLPTGPAVGGEVEDYRHNWQPTAVKLLSFTAAPRGSTILVTWETASEVDNLGFHLYRREVGMQGYTRLNQALIPSRSPGQGEGATYAFVDEGVRGGVTYEYLLEDVDLAGRRTPHGPVAARALYVVFLPEAGK